MRTLKDSEFIRGNIPMTKEEVRTITLSKLDIQETDHIIDIGAGTGSLSIEAARRAPRGQVYAIDLKEEAIDLIQQNAQKHGVENLKVIYGRAPEDLPLGTSFHKVIIGGTSGGMEKVFDWMDLNRKNDFAIVINAITLETLTQAEQMLKKWKFDEIEIIQVAVNRFEKIGGYNMLKAQTPVFILSAVKLKNEI